MVKLLIAVQHIFAKVQLKKENLKSFFWVPEFGSPNWHTGLPNGLDTSLEWFTFTFVTELRTHGRNKSYRLINQIIK